MKEVLKKVQFPVEVLKYRSEGMWCLPVAGNIYILASIPFFHDIPPKSVIEVEEDEYGELVFSKIVEKGEYMVYHCVGLSFDRNSFSENMKSVSTEVWSDAWENTKLVYAGVAVPKGEKKEEVLQALNAHGLWSPLLAKDSDACDIVLYRNLLSAKKLLKLHKPALLEEKIIW